MGGSVARDDWAWLQSHETENALLKYVASDMFGWRGCVFMWFDCKVLFFTSSAHLVANWQACSCTRRFSMFCDCVGEIELLELHASTRECNSYITIAKQVVG